MAATSTFLIQRLGVTIRATVADAGAAAFRRVLAGHFRFLPATAAAQVEWHVVAGRELAAPAGLSVGGLEPVASSDSRYLLDPSERVIVIDETTASPWALHNANRQCRVLTSLLALPRTRCRLHASMVRLDGRGILLLGDRFSGKTTAMLALCFGGGAHCLSNDDVTVLANPLQPLAFGSPRTIGVRSDTLPYLEGLRPGVTRALKLSNPTNQERSGDTAKMYLHTCEIAEITDRETLESAVVDAIVFTEFIKDSHTRPSTSRLAVPDAADRMRRSLNPDIVEGSRFWVEHLPQPDPSRMSDEAARLADEAPAFVLSQRLDDLGATLTLVRRAVSAGWPESPAGGSGYAASPDL